MEESEDMITIVEAAERIGRTPDALRKAVKNKTIHAVWKYGRWLLEPSEVDRYGKQAKKGRPRKSPTPQEDAE
jgi:hypothetical protein